MKGISFERALMAGAGAAALAAASAGWAQAAQATDQAAQPVPGAAGSTVSPADKPSAQPDPGSPVPALGDEIVVTAQRRAETLSKVPISVAAYGQQQMDQQGVRSINDIARLTPGLAQSLSARSDRSGEILSIRGISSASGSATTGVYIDDTPVQVRPVAANSSNPYPRIFDLERVEVLRGPQGTLFGAGSEGGTVRFITPAPNLRDTKIYARGEVSGTQGGGVSGEAGAAVGVPLVTDKLAVRISGWARHDTGFVDRVDVHNTSIVDRGSNYADYKVVRGALRWEPVEGFSLQPSVFYQDNKVHDTGQFFQNYSTRTNLRNGSPLRQPSHDRFVLPGLEAQLDRGGISIVSVTSYLSRRVNSGFDATLLDDASLGGFATLPPPAPLDQRSSSGTITERNRFFTQEVRLQNSDPTARLRWVVGGFYQKTRQNSTFQIQNNYLDELIRANPAFAFLGPNRTAAQLFGVGLYQNLYELYSATTAHDKQLAGFGQVDFDITPKLTATAGVRYADQKFTSNGFQAGTVFRTNGTTTILSQEAHPVTPKFGLSYKAERDLLLYFTAAKGYRIGGAVAPLPVSCAADASAIGLSLNTREIAPDSVWSYEVGAKGRLFDRKLQFEGSVYRIDWTNIQSGLTLPNCNIPTTANLGTARSQGFDLQLSASPAHALTTSVAVGYTDAHFTSTSYGAVNPASGQRGVLRSSGQPLGTPPWTVSASAEYVVPVRRFDSYYRADFQFQSHDNTPLDLAALADPTVPRAPARTNLDLRAGVRFDHVDASIFVANVTNAQPRFGTFRETLATSIYHSVTVRPRTVGLTVTYRN